MYLIAEIGINHNGDMDLVDSMIRAAALAGADCVKFQKRTVNVVYEESFLDQPRESPWGNTQRAQKNGLELTFNDYCEIDKICKDIGIDWTASAWDEKSLEMVESFAPPFHKVASPFITHHNFLSKVASYERPVMLSTGMSTLPMIHTAVQILSVERLTLLHCVSIYPCPDELCNISAISTLRAHFPQYDIGYSGHERGIEPSLMAIGLGAKVIERHFTLDRASYGSDQAASLEPKGLSRIREYGNQIEKCMGDGIIKILPQEHAAAAKLRYWE